MDNTIKVFITSVLRYEDKKTNEPKIRIAYVNQEKGACQNNQRLKGFPELSAFVKFDEKVWNGIELKDFYQPATFTFEPQRAPYDPMKVINVLKTIEVNGKTISVL